MKFFIPSRVRRLDNVHFLRHDRLFLDLTNQLQQYEKSEYICKLCKNLHNCLITEKGKKNCEKLF
jgi:hypothetical protein